MLSSSFYLGYTTMHKKMPTIPTGRQVEEPVIQKTGSKKKKNNT
jgi:hypothetical protein